MFRECPNLIKLDLSSFTMPNCTNISWMFGSSQKIVEIDLSSFEIKEGAYISQMFYNCRSLEKLDIRKFDITNTTGYDYYWIYPVKTTCSIIVNQSMKDWFTENLPSYTNVTIGS